MSFRKIKYLYLKEIHEILRNWGLIILLVFFPLIVYPSTMIFMAEYGASQQAKLEKQKSRISICGSEFASELVKLLKDNKDLELFFCKDVDKNSIPVQNKAILSIPSSIENIVSNSDSINIGLFYDSADDESKLAKGRIEEILTDYRKELILRRLDNRKLKPGFIEPVIIKPENVATRNKIMGKHLGEILPLILITFIMLGTIQVAMDITAGEKERKTIQTLLLSPLSRMEILCSKLLVVLTTTFITTAINFISVGFTMFFVYRFTEKNMSFAISFSSVVLSLLIAIPLVVMISSLFILVGLMAKNQLEANIYVLPILFIGILPAGLPSIPGIKFDTWMYFIPIANTALAVKEIFLGTITNFCFVITFIMNTVYAIIIMIITGRLFRKEDIAFGGLSDIIMVKQDKTTPSPGEAIIFFLTTLALYIFVGNHLQEKNLKVGLIESQVLLLLVPAFYFIKRGGYDYKKVLKIRFPGLRTIFLAPVIGWTTIIISQFYEKFQNSFFEMPKEIERFMVSILSFSDWKEAVIVFLVIAVMPSIIEEIVFRGIILSGFEKSFNRILVCIAVGFLFSLFHLNIYILLPVTIMGAVLTYAVMKSGSIFTGIIIHFTINGTQIILSNLIKTDFNIPLFALYFSIILLLSALFLIPENKKGSDSFS